MSLVTTRLESLITRRVYWRLNEDKDTETDLALAGTVERVVMCIAHKLAKDLLEIGNDPGVEIHRIQFIGGKYPDNETTHGGMCETVLADFFYKKLKEYFSA